MVHRKIATILSLLVSSLTLCLKPNRFKRSIEYALEQRALMYQAVMWRTQGSISPYIWRCWDRLKHHHLLALAFAPVSQGSAWSSPAGRSASHVSAGSCWSFPSAHRNRSIFDSGLFSLWVGHVTPLWWWYRLAWPCSKQQQEEKRHWFVWGKTGKCAQVTTCCLKN